MKISVIGDTGLLGRAAVRHFASKGRHQVLGVSSSDRSPLADAGICEVDYRHLQGDLLLEKDRVLRKVRAFEPHLILNCAGIVNLQACEQHPESADALHAGWPRFLAQAALEIPCGFVHISTDQVYGDCKTTPYKEEDQTRPVNVYGKTKLRGEEAVLSVNRHALVVRTNIVGCRRIPGRPSFSEWLFRALHDKKDITLFDDYITNPIHVADLCHVIETAYGLRLSGILNLAGRETVSKYDFGRLLAGALALDFSVVRKGRLEKSDLTPRRPSYLGLDVSLAEEKLGFPLPGLKEAIEKLADEFSQKKGVLTDVS